MKISPYLRILAGLIVSLVLVFTISSTTSLPGLSDTAQAKNCLKGIPCGRTCIAAWKTCHVDSYPNLQGRSSEDSAPIPTSAPSEGASPAADDASSGSSSGAVSSSDSSSSSLDSRAAWESINQPPHSVIGVSAYPHTSVVLRSTKGEASGWKVMCGGKSLKGKRHSRTMFRSGKLPSIVSLS